MKDTDDAVRDFLVRSGLNCGVEHRLLDISSELGEVSKEVLKASEYGKVEPRMTEDLAEEVGDLLFAVHALASELDLDSQERLTAALKKYEARRLAKGQIGSETNE